MLSVSKRLAALGTAIPEIILPAPAINLEKWAVIACDQFTQDREYWERAKSFIGNAPTALNLILPELYLTEPDVKDRIDSIHQSMPDYLKIGALSPPRHCGLYIERRTPHHDCRRGLILAVDLECYGWRPPEDRLLIRATEGTVAERLPARMSIRRDAVLELPHILLLLDDENNTLLPAIGAIAKKAAPVYETPLMTGAGDISGWALETEEDLEPLAAGLEKLAARANDRYGVHDAVKFLYAVGDGNHSLASAKAVWEEYKAGHAGESGIEKHPSRWALVEIENLYDPGIDFEPIHRAIFGVNVGEVLSALSELPGFECNLIGSWSEVRSKVGDRLAQKTRVGVIGKNEMWIIEWNATGIATELLQPLLDNFVKEQNLDVASIDYIHGEEELLRIITKDSAVGIVLPPVKKSGLFETVARAGALPRKSFSMGEAIEKRFYLECRKLTY
jgi:hypothetical protein